MVVVIESKEQLVKFISDLNKGEVEKFSLQRPDGKYYVYDFAKRIATVSTEEVEQLNPFYVSKPVTEDIDLSNEVEEVAIDLSEDLAKLAKDEKLAKKQARAEAKEKAKQEKADRKQTIADARLQKAEARKQKALERKERIKNKLSECAPILTVAMSLLCLLDLLVEVAVIVLIFVK